MVKQHGRRNAPKSMMKEAQSVLDQGALTIAFARRFATYKRATLLLKDPDRLEAILNSEEYPVQFIFAGKAHPKDNEGKELIKRIVDFAGNPGMQHKIVFLEDYDINIARHLVQGADVWLNTPRRPFEACGTSGIKAAVNGVLNLSVLDGWWCEGFTEETGWSLGNGEEYQDHNYQDAVESQALYNILENDVIPCFYERKEGDLPIRWLKMMKASMTMGILNFCAKGMVEKYKKNFYLPAAKRLKELVNNDAQEAKSLKDTHQKLLRLWKGIRVEHPLRESDGPFRVGEALNITTVVHLGKLRPEDVIVELYYGNMKSIDTLSTSQPETMGLKEKGSNGDYLYSCTINCCFSGRFGFTARVIPNGDDMIKNAPGFMTWAGE
jgi:starch phosphorylase